jgi:hypothetical protein
MLVLWGSLTEQLANLNMAQLNSWKLVGLFMVRWRIIT